MINNVEQNKQTHVTQPQCTFTKHMIATAMYTCCNIKCESNSKCGLTSSWNTSFRRLSSQQNSQPPQPIRQQHKNLNNHARTLRTYAQTKSNKTKACLMSLLELLGLHEVKICNKNAQDQLQMNLEALNRSVGLNKVYKHKETKECVRKWTMTGL